MCLNPVSRLLTSCLVVSSVILNHLTTEIIFFPLFEYCFPIDFGKIGTAGRPLWRPSHPQGPASPAQAGLRQPLAPHLSAAACQRATSRRPPSPPRRNSRGWEQTSLRGRDELPAVATSRAGAGSLTEVTAPAPLRAPAGCKVNGEPPFRSPSPLRRNHHHHYHTRRRGGPAAWRERSLSPPGQGGTARTRHSWGGGGGAEPCQAAPRRPLRGCGWLPRRAGVFREKGRLNTVKEE